MLILLDSRSKISASWTTAAYNNLGLIRMRTGLYSEALNYYNTAENMTDKSIENSESLASIYSNKSRIFKFGKAYTRAIDYLEKAIRLYKSIPQSSKTILSKTSTAYLNLGIIYYELADYKTALEYLVRSITMKEKYGLSEVELVYLNLAKTYDKLGEFSKSEDYFNRCIETFLARPGKPSFRLADAYFDYGSFLLETGRYNEAVNIHFKALSLCLQYYGIKHPLTSLAYQHITDNYIRLTNYGDALKYNQDAIIAVVNNFSNHDLYSNPEVDSSLNDLTLLDNLKTKSRILDLLSGEQQEEVNKEKLLKKSYETINLAVTLIAKIRNNYISDESRMYLDANEKETYIYAIQLLFRIDSLSHEAWIPGAMFSIVQRAKAAVLQDELIRNEMIAASSTADSLHRKQTELTSQISAYQLMVNEEAGKTNPDANVIAKLKDDMFELDREKEHLADEFTKEFPLLLESFNKAKVLSLSDLQKKLDNDEAILNYLISNNYSEGKRKLYTFIIKRHAVDVQVSDLDSLFPGNALIIQRSNGLHKVMGGLDEDYRENTQALWYMYNILVKPVEDKLKVRRLIIIPDEEISKLPFEAFIKELPDNSKSDYESLKYLINDYSFSYAYTSSQVVASKSNLNNPVRVFAFSPDYRDQGLAEKAIEPLEGAEKEISSILNIFGGRNFADSAATLKNFRQFIETPVIFHLAMHSVSDTANSSYSYLLFDTRKDTLNGGKLYNYEITLSRVSSPMIVLSACNSGQGTLYRSEGLLSIARGFMLAGAKSVINTSWDINDETSAEIINRFYYHLSKGLRKDEAMRLAKIEYLRNSPAVYTNPYFWAAYKVTGVTSPLTQSTSVVIIRALIFILLPALIITINYFRRRKSFSALS